MVETTTWTWQSNMPGSTAQPLASTASSPSRPLPTPRMRPPSTTTSASASALAREPLALRQVLAPLPLEAVREIERRAPGLEVREGYGCTESGAVISSTPAGRRRLGSVGLPLPGYEVRILDEMDQEVPLGERGEICCRAPGVMLGYWDAPETTADTLRGGWLHSGDIGYLDEDGYLWVVDRKKDLIIRGGFNVFPRDVEETLVAHPAVAMAGVVGRPDSLHGEEVVAFVALRPGSSAGADELVEFARSRLSAYKYPREVHVLDDLPLTPVGK